MNTPPSTREYSQDQRELMNRIRMCKEEARLKHDGSWALYHSDPEGSATLRREAVALEDEVKTLELILMAIKENPVQVPEYVERIPLRTRFRNWLRSWL